MHIDVPFVGHHRIPGQPAWVSALTGDRWAAFVHTVDALGYHGITTSEHFAMPENELDRLGPYWAHSISVLAFIAGATKRVRLDTTVLVLPYHHPLQLAKALATIDVLSNGRLNVSIGVGHAEREFAALGIPFEERGARTDELLAAMHELWTADRPVHRGRFFTIEGLAFEPKPLQRLPPIYVGGNSKVAHRRAARHDGWQPNPMQLRPREIPELLEYVAAQPEFAGKADTFDVFWVGDVAPQVRQMQFAALAPADRARLADDLVAAYERLAGFGVRRAQVAPLGTDDFAEYLEYLAWFDAEVGARVAGVQARSLG
jgi:probable F420-dependent oxidoreductase